MHKVAAATQDGLLILEHFGHAERFFLYEVFEDGSFWFEKEIRIPPFSPEEERTPHGRVKTIAGLLAGVNGVFAQKIGPKAAKLLADHGIHAYAIGGNIQEALRMYGKRIPFIERLSKGSG
ncbi:MAG: hypothetical protein LBL26_01535 [Peptococcaceae bacterium]|jgi:predicted Fe-Mo cluster-binding NifX family protein|nr:hypothetical protein [Peptococcaceae bacterium]